MRLESLVQTLALTVLTNDSDLSVEVTGGYASDLMSDVIAHAQPGDVWVTLQIHLNAVAVASMKETAAVIFVGGRNPADDVLRKAEAEGVVLLTTHLPAFEIIGRLYAQGLRSADQE